MRSSEFTFDMFFLHRIYTLINIYSERQIRTAILIYIYIYNRHMWLKIYTTELYFLCILLEHFFKTQKVTVNFISWSPYYFLFDSLALWCLSYILLMTMEVPYFYERTDILSIKHRTAEQLLVEFFPPCKENIVPFPHSFINSFIHAFIHIFIPYSVLKQFRNVFSTEFHLISSLFSCPESHKQLFYSRKSAKKLP